jgi:CRP-like cAMP-binding protein
MSERIDFLKKTDLLNGVPDDLFKGIVEAFQEIRAKAGETIFQEGEIGDGVDVVVEGSLNLVTNQVKVLQVESGEWVGELALIDEAPRSASAIAETDALLLKWTREDFMKALKGNPEVVHGILKTLSRKLRQDLALQVKSTVRGFVCGKDCHLRLLSSGRGRGRRLLRLSSSGG